MGESMEHMLLVSNLIAYIRAEFKHVFALVLLADTATAVRGDKPPVINGFVPDIFAFDVPTTITIVGEAKTTRDIETDRSRAQIRAFIDFLRWRPQSFFILAVPIGVLGAARTVVNSIRRDAPSELPQIVLLHGLTPQSLFGH